jgi:hypothetical protein
MYIVKHHVYYLILIFSPIFSCSIDDSKTTISERHKNSLWIHYFNKQLTNIIISDVFSPPQTSRIYAYANLAAYEAMRVDDKNFPSISKKLKKFKNIPANNFKINHLIAGVTAFAYVGKKLVYDSLLLHNAQNLFYETVKNNNFNSSVFEFSKKFGEIVGKVIYDRSAIDGYLQRTSKKGYLVDEKNISKWQPTPPAYMDAIEPHWNSILPFVIDSAQQFKPKKHTPFSIEKKSKFYNEAIDVYNAVNNLNKEQLSIAMFWDCNPNQSNNFGHLMYNNQQISPAGHWIHITCQVAEQENLSNLEASYALAKVGITLADSFIIAWDEKYRSNLIRPESYINKYIDPDWKPILETPPFPEHTSAHSVASKGASLMLTNIFGENYAYTDSTEIPFGLPVRKYDSFEHASDEAAISRIYGGIHYRPAIEFGKQQGEELIQFVLNKLKDSIDLKRNKFSNREL